MKRSIPPFRADHVGSLLRPQKLITARDEFAQKKITAEQLRAIEDEAIKDVVKLQEDIGLQGISDGEFRRTTWHMDFLYQINGVEKSDKKIHVHFENEDGDLDFEGSEATVVAPLKLNKTIFGDDFSFLKSVTKKGTPKLTIPSPSMLHYRGGRGAISESVYPSLEKFWHDLGETYADEVEAIGKLGCKYLQLDDTSLAYLNDPKQREYVESIGGDSKNQHLKYINVFNQALRKKPADMAICTHLCKGNYKSSWAASGSYDYVAEALFNELNVDGFFMEWDDERSGNFEALRFVPKGKTVVLGLVTTKHAQLESKDLIKRRLEEASQFLDLDQICLSPQCGFSSTCEGNAVTLDDQIAKLKLVVEVAQEVWG